MNINEIQSLIKEYFTDNLPNYLEEQELPALSEFVDDYLDLDQYKKSKTLFFDFQSWNIQPLSNESDNGQLRFNIYIVVRNAKSSELKTMQNNYAAAVYNFIKNNRSLDCCDWSTVDSVEFFDAVDGDKNIKIVQLAITTQTEID